MRVTLHGQVLETVRVWAVPAILSSRSVDEAVDLVLKTLPATMDSRPGSGARELVEETVMLIDTLVTSLREEGKGQ
jgi:hypothetical protein